MYEIRLSLKTSSFRQIKEINRNELIMASLQLVGYQNLAQPDPLVQTINMNSRKLNYDIVSFNRLVEAHTLRDCYVVGVSIGLNWAELSWDQCNDNWLYLKISPSVSHIPIQTSDRIDWNDDFTVFHR